MDNWQECTQTCRGVMSRRMPLNTQMGLGHDRFDPALGAWVSDYRLQRKQPPSVLSPLVRADGGSRLGCAGPHDHEGSEVCLTRIRSASVEQFLYREARLLDERRFHDWLRLFTDDVRYRMAARTNRYPRSSKAIVILDPERYAEEDQDRADELGLFDEDIETLSARVARLDTGMAWAEDPPSRTRHLITNIEVVPERVGLGADGPLQFHRLPQPRGDRAGFLCRRPPGQAAACRWRMEDRGPPDGARPERLDGQEPEHLLLMLVAVDADSVHRVSTETTYRNFRCPAAQCSGWPPPAIAAIILWDARF